MHILIIPSAYPTEDAALRGTFFKEQAIALKENNLKVGVIYSETRRITGININTLKKFHFQVKDSIEEGIRTIRLQGWNILMMRNSLGINLWINQTVKLFKTYIKKYGVPDIIHVHIGLYGGIAAKRIKEIYNIPYIITEHSSHVLNGTLNEYHRKLLKEGYDNADCLISVGEKLKSKMMNFTSNEIEVIPNIVNTEKFIINKNKENKNRFRFVSVSFLTDNKNVDLTIRAFGKAFKGKEAFELYIAGDGTAKTKLENLVRELRLENQVKFVGKVSREKLPEFLNEGDCFVLPSKYETFGVVYIEALSCGLPIITTKCGGPEDFFREDLGYIIDVGDEEALVEAMRDIVVNKENFNGETMSKYIKNKFSEAVIAREITRVYNRVLEDNRKNR